MTTAQDAPYATPGLDGSTTVMSEPTPFETLQTIALSYSLSRCLHVIADLGVADRLDSGPRTTADLAACLNVHPDALGRVLRLLAAHGIFEIQGETVRHSPLSQLLRSDHPQSMRAFVRMFGTPIMWKAYEAFERSIRTALPATAEVLPQGLFSYFAQHPKEAALFDEAMAVKARSHVTGILTAYDFSSYRRIGDIGGGRGHLLRAVLDAVPSARGVLFDLPHVIQQAADPASERLTLHPGDFFRDPLPACDLYLLMEVIHDWGDGEAIAILQAVRQAAPAQARVLIIEQMIPNNPGPSWTKLLDIHMLALLGGRQRTRQEYAALLETSGFTLQRELQPPAGISILEARPA